MMIGVLSYRFEKVANDNYAQGGAAMLHLALKNRGNIVIQSRKDIDTNMTVAELFRDSLINVLIFDVYRKG